MKRRWKIAAVVVVALAAMFSCGCRMLAGMARGEPEWRQLRKKPQDFGLAADRIVLESRDHLAVTAWWLTPASTGAQAAVGGSRTGEPAAAARSDAISAAGELRSAGARPPARATIVVV